MKRMHAVLAALPMAALLTACGGPSADDGRPSVVAASYPFAFVADRVGGSLVDLTNLTSPGTAPHDLELKPKQVGAVLDADLVVYEKDFQAAVDQAVDQADRDDDATIDVASLVTMLPPPAEDEHEDEHAGEGEEHHAEDGHDHGDADPHTWLDPTTMVALAKDVQKRLSAIDPDHADDFRANADRLVDELTTLDTEISTGLETCRTRTIVTSHAAFQYLAARYDLKQVPIAGLEPSNEPSPSQLADITALVRAEKITTIFTEELVSPAIADTVARETGAVTETLDPIEGLSQDTADETYLTLMRKNLAVLQKANGCS
jgi:zinc transport system substrate-binding protein